MEPTSAKKRSTKKIILRITAVFFILIITGCVILYFNLNRILTSALNKNFSSSLISDVYEFKFKDLSVNFLLGNVSVYNVEFQPLKKPLKNYPYINSTLRLKTSKMILRNVELMALIKTDILRLDKVEIEEPSVQFKIEDKIPVFFPFQDSVAGNQKKDKKKSIESFSLKEFKMIDASFQVANSAREREFNVQKINLTLNEILIDQQHGKDIISYKKFSFSIGELTGNVKKEPLRYIGFKDFSINVDSLQLEHTVDTAIYNFSDFSIGLKALDIQTADSLFHLTLGSFDLSYKNKSIKLNDISFKPNVSDATIQRRYTYQHSQASATIGSLSVNNLNFDSLILKRKLFIDEVVLDKVNAAIYKDNTKPVDKKKFPVYLGQSISSLSLPLHIKQVKITNANLVNTERKPDGNIAKANINRGTVTVNNITNQSSEKPLEMMADAYIENKAHTKLTLAFSYTEPQFTMKGRLEKFNLQDLNQLIYSYTPAKISKGITDEITFSGTVFRTYSTGNLQFLYHDLKVDLELRKQAKWKSDVLAFAANTALHSSNPASADIPARHVSFHADRDMHKSFINLIIKSLLDGLKETMIMSKENKKAFKQEKREAKKEARKEKKSKKE